MEGDDNVDDNINDTEVESKENEIDFPLHKVFVDLSLENDLKGEDLEWFKSRISKKETKKDEVQPESGSVSKVVEILTEDVIEKPVEKPEKLFLKISETNTIWFLSLETYFSQDNLEDAEVVKRENETYEMKKVKKELIRKRCMAETQTPTSIIKPQGTLTSEIIMKDASVFASEWDIYDTYNALDEGQFSASKNFFTALGDTKPTEKPTDETESALPLSPIEQESQIFKSKDFKYASLVTERLLASNCFQSKQSIFKSPFKTRYSEDPTLYSYDLEPLWNFQKDFQPPLMVTCMDWNPMNPDLLAAGYGNLEFGKITSGIVCVWSPKNPRQPEKQYSMDDSVTSLHFSRIRPNILAVGTSRGKVYVLDISSSTGCLRNLESTISRPEPIWKVEWFLHTELIFENEELLAVGESGVLMRFSFTNESTEVLKLDYVTEMKNLPMKKIPKRSSKPPPKQYVTYDRKIFSGLWLSISSDCDFCYVSTKEGVIVRCDLRNPSMTDEIILAHEGPVFTIQHSPVTDLVFFTCGADWTLKIWMESITQPLITLQHKAALTCACWSPTIPTIIATLSETELSIWDIARNILSPMSVRKFEDCETTFTSVLFSGNGQNIVIGGQDGMIRVVHLTQLPRIPFLQKEALINALKSGLFKNQELTEKFRRVVETNKNKLKTDILMELYKL